MSVWDLRAPTFNWTTYDISPSMTINGRRLTPTEDLIHRATSRSKEINKLIEYHSKQLAELSDEVTLLGKLLESVQANEKKNK